MRKLLSMIFMLILSALLLANLTITGVNVKDYPKVVIYAHIDVPDPDSAIYTVYEDSGKSFTASLQDFKTLSRKPKVDFIFVFDITGSMEEEIEGVKEKAKDFADFVRSAGFDCRFSLVTFKDRVIKGNYGFTSNVYEFKRWLSSLSAKGGGDMPEAALDALVYAMRLPVRKDAQKVLILITDAPYHYRGDGSHFSKYTKEDVRKMLEKAGFTLYSVSPPTRDYKSLVEGFGKVFDIHSSSGFKSIIDKVAKTFLSQIALVYVTEEREGGSRVSFRVKADYSGSEGKGVYQGRGEYKVPPRPRIEELTITQEGCGFIDPSKPEAQAILLAREAAILDAKRSILEILNKVHVDKETTVSNAMASDEFLKTQVEGLVMGGEVIEENLDETFGQYCVKVRVNLKKIFDDILKTPVYQPIWQNRIVVARGVVVINKNLKPAGRAILMARRGAIAEAQAKLLEAIKGVHINASTTVKDKMTENVQIVAKVEGVLRGAVIIDEMKEHMSLNEICSKGYYWVTMAVAMDEEGFKYLLEKYGQGGGGSLADALELIKSKPSEKPETPPSPEKPSITFSWFIIDASGLRVMPTFEGYTLYSKDGKMVFSPSMCKGKIPMDYSITIENASKKAGGKPFIVKALEVNVKEGKIILDADYDTLHSVLIEEGLGTSAKITVVTDKLEAIAKGW